jgi:hypothetical protein
MKFRDGIAREEFRHDKKAYFPQLPAAEDGAQVMQGVSKVLHHVVQTLDPGDKRGVDDVDGGRFFARQDGGDRHGRQGLVIGVSQLPNGRIGGIHSWQRRT